MKGKTWCETTLQAYGLQPRTLLRTDSITDIFVQILKITRNSYPTCPTTVNSCLFRYQIHCASIPQQYKEYGVA